MKKTLLYVCVCISFTHFATAQQIWNDNFNDSNVSDWTVINLDAKTDGSETNIWRASRDIKVNGTGVFDYTIGSRNIMGTYVMRNNGQLYGDGEQDDWAVSPPIDLTGNDSQALTVTLHAQSGIYAPAGQLLKVYLGYAPDDLSDVANTFTEIGSIVLSRQPTEQTADLFADYKVEIDAAFNIGGEIYLAFRAEDHYSIEIDEVKLSIERLSTNDEVKNQFKIKQNPVKDALLFVDNAMSQEDMKVNIYSANGMLVKTAGYSKEGVGVASLTNGLYVAHVETPEGTVSLKFVKN